MPLNVTVAINGRPIQAITIGRMEDFKGEDYWHTYFVTTTREDGVEEAATFGHLYRNGAEECVRRALEALSNQRERSGRRGS